MTRVNTSQEFKAGYLRWTITEVNANLRSGSECGSPSGSACVSLGSGTVLSMCSGSGVCSGSGTGVPGRLGGVPGKFGGVGGVLGGIGGVPGRLGGVKGTVSLKVGGSGGIGGRLLSTGRLLSGGGSGGGMPGMWLATGPAENKFLSVRELRENALGGAFGNWRVVTSTSLLNGSRNLCCLMSATMHLHFAFK